MKVWYHFGADKDGALFRTGGRIPGRPQRMTQPDAYRTIQRQARQGGIKTKIGNHSLRLTCMTGCLKHELTLDQFAKVEI